MKKHFYCYLVLILATACQPSLSENGRLRPYEQTSFFKDHSSARPWPEGVVPRREQMEKEPPPTIESLQRGQEQFRVFCQVCHGLDGRGKGMAVQRGFPQPINLMEEPLLSAPTELFFQTMSNGYGRMFSYANRISKKDRWAIAQYIRVLQLQQHFPAGQLSEQDLKQLRDAL